MHCIHIVAERYHDGGSDLVFLVVVCERERKGDIERFALERRRGSLARLERQQKIHPSCRSLPLERLDELGAEYLHQQVLEVPVHSYGSKHVTFV